MVDQHAPLGFFCQLLGMDYDQLFTEFNVRVTRQACFSAEVSQVATIEGSEASRVDGLNGLKGQNSALKEEKNVSFLEGTCSQLCYEVSDYKLFKEKIKVVQNEQVKVLSDKVAELNSNLMGMALQLDEEFYLRFLTTIAGWKGAIGRAIDKGMQDRLAEGIDHGKARRGLVDMESQKDASMVNIMGLLHLDGLAAETLEADHLQPSPKQLMLPIHRLVDQVVIGETSLSFSLDVVYARVRRIQGDATSQCLSIIDAMVPLIEPLSAENLIGEASTSRIPAMAMTTAFHSDEPGIVQAQGQAHVGGVAIRKPVAEATCPFPVVEGKDNTSANVVREIPSHADAETGADTYKTLDNTTQNLGSRVFTLELRDLPRKINQTINAVVKEAIHIALQAPLRDHFRELPEAYIKEILHQLMFESGSYKSLPEHITLYEALEEFMEWETGTSSLPKKTSLERDVQSTPQSNQPVEDVPMPNDVNIFDSEETNTTHLPKIKARPDWLKPLPEEDRPETLETDLIIPATDLLEAENNWADALAKSYKYPEENKLLSKTGDMGSFIKWFCKRIGKNKLSKSDLKGPTFKGHRLAPDMSKPLPIGGLPGQVTIPP
uniref:Uncharacterized protein n=1 Tax=Tanacetum cinerariifolium TaxID=118510 RepID=A0A6L2P6J9_TANCI|nr:hypothetical protein [Tanacetum cinerariifolium]